MSPNDPDNETRTGFEAEAVLIRGRIDDVEREQAQAKQRDEEYRQRNIAVQERMAGLQGSMVILTSVLAICAIVGGGIAVWQTSVARRAAQAAERSAKIAEDTLDSNDESFQDTLIQMKAQGRATMHGAAAAQRSADVARDALVRGQRAFISFSQAWQWDSVANQADAQHVAVWEFRPVLVNSGETPTRGATHRVNWQIMGPALPAHFDFRDIETGTPTMLFGLAPREQKTGAVVQIPSVFLNLVHLQPQMFHIYFWGWARYHDVFAGTPEHMTMFCWDITDVRSDPNAINIPLLVTGEQCIPTAHNCSDEECDGEHYGNGQIWRARTLR